VSSSAPPSPRTCQVSMMCCSTLRGARRCCNKRFTCSCIQCAHTPAHHSTPSTQSSDLRAPLALWFWSTSGRGLPVSPSGGGGGVQQLYGGQRRAQPLANSPANVGRVRSSRQTAAPIAHTRSPQAFSARPRGQSSSFDGDESWGYSC
jgi:hypothetical protein